MLHKDLLAVINKSLVEGSLWLSCRRAMITFLPRNCDLPEIRNRWPIKDLYQDIESVLQINGGLSASCSSYQRNLAKMYTLQNVTLLGNWTKVTLYNRKVYYFLIITYNIIYQPLQMSSWLWSMDNMTLIPWLQLLNILEVFHLPI